MFYRKGHWKTEMRGSREKAVVINILWRFAERCGTQAVSFAVSLILARLLLPEDYGVVALIEVFMEILRLFVDCGFKNALVQKKNADQTDFSSVFYLHLSLGVLLYLCMFAAAPVIAGFYGYSEMTAAIRVMSLTLVLGGVNGVQHALVEKRMEFKRFFYSSLGGTLLSAVVGIGMAYAGFGLWALIAQRLTDQAVDTLVLAVTIRWRPSPCFSLKRLKPLGTYGGRILGASVLNSFVSNLTGLIVGKVYSASTLAYYDKGRRIPLLAVANVQASVQSVLFPAMAACQDQKERVRAILRRSVMAGAYVIFPIMTGIAMCAEPLVRILYTEKWIDVVPFLIFWCFIYLFHLLNTANIQAIQAVGRSDIFFRIEVIKQAISLLVIILVIPFGVLALLSMMCVENILFYYINARPNRELVGYGFSAQLRDIAPIFLLNVVMGLTVWGIGHLPLPDIPLLVLQILGGAGIYLAGSVIMKLEILKVMARLAREVLGSH